MEIPAIIGLTILFELLTVAPRLLLKVRSRDVQKRIGMPRIHHGYVGMLFLVLPYLFPAYASALWIIGWALILSDLVHHYTVLPLLSITEIDMNKKHYGLSTTSLRRKVLIIAIATSVVAVLASISYSAWLGVVAIAMIAVSENLQVILPRFKCPQEIAVHF